MAHVWEKSYPSGVRWDTPLPPAVPLESLLETAATTRTDVTLLPFFQAWCREMKRRGHSLMTLARRAALWLPLDRAYRSLR